ncbi:NTP transferase domain-containing protein [Candidatus Woesebacteria bacterium]|nr:NTP transferase domain-containing protein [Candidatus Woesebacteria bacterium]
MRRSRITITLDNTLLKKVDRLIDKEIIRNRSHAIEYIISQHTQAQIHKAVILAGGHGTHLRPYTYEIPKSLLPISGKPLLEHTILELKKNNITEIIIAINYLGNKIKEYFQDGSRFGVSITYSQETQDLSTGGALKKIKKVLQQEPFFVIYGDIVAHFPYNDFGDFHKETGEIATIAVTTADNPGEFGQFHIRGNTLVNFYPQSDKKHIKTHLIHCGIYAFEPEIFQYFPKKDSFSLEDVCARLIENRKVSGYMFEGEWFDVGNPANYEKAVKYFKKSS